jgi:hypothetical protein
VQLCGDATEEASALVRLRRRRRGRGGGASRCAASGGCAICSGRATGGAGGSGVRITELSLFGKEGAATPRYGFKESPAKSLEVIAALEGMPIDRAMPADEEAMLEDGADGTFDRIGFAEAALIASGVTDEATRKAELAAIDRLVAAATASLAGSGDLAAKGEALLRFLHAGPMKGGYEGGQTDVSKIIETGRFNCVSSAALYNIVGRRLGLDLRGVEVPEHAFSILYDGRRHMDVETTIPEGFNPGRESRSSDGASSSGSARDRCCAPAG